MEASSRQCKVRLEVGRRRKKAEVRGGKREGGRWSCREEEGGEFHEAFKYGEEGDRLWTRLVPKRGLRGEIVKLKQ